MSGIDEGFPACGVVGRAVTPSPMTPSQLRRRTQSMIENSRSCDASQRCQSRESTPNYSRLKSLTRPPNISVADYVTFNGPDKYGSVGLKGYFLAKKYSGPVYPKHSKIFNSKTKDFIDIAINQKKDVPNKFYQTQRSLLDSNTKSAMCKGERKTQFDDIVDYQKKHNFPAPNAHSPNKEVILKRDKAILNYREERHGFLDDAKFRGQQQANFYTPNFEQVERRSSVPKYRGKIREDYDVAVALKNTFATKSISPAQYNMVQAYDKTQVKSLKYNMRPRRPGLYEAAVKQAKVAPGPGKYQIKENAYSLLTRGASRGWK